MCARRARLRTALTDLALAQADAEARAQAAQAQAAAKPRGRKLTAKQLEKQKQREEIKRRMHQNAATPARTASAAKPKPAAMHFFNPNDSKARPVPLQKGDRPPELMAPRIAASGTRTRLKLCRLAWCSGCCTCVGATPA